MIITAWNSHKFTSDNGTHRVTSPLSDGPVFSYDFTTKLTLYYFILFVCKHLVTQPTLRIKNECDKHLLSTETQLRDKSSVIISSEISMSISNVLSNVEYFLVLSSVMLAPILQV